MHYRISILALSTTVLFSSCNKTEDIVDLPCYIEVNTNVPDVETSGISYPTTQSLIGPSNANWSTPSSANEIINNLNYLVYLGAGPQAMPDSVWDDFEFEYPFTRNLDRNLHMDSTIFIKSPNAPANCQGLDCFSFMTYEGYSWLELAQTLTDEYVPCLTDTLNLGVREVPEGHLQVSTIAKCQILQFVDDIYQLTDNEGNYFVMHATENGTQTTDVVLPAGWDLEIVSLNEPLIVTPFGNDEDCYFNIVVDHLGQGYHQFIYSGDVYPNN
jgi:hypothetical protein